LIREPKPRFAKASLSKPGTTTYWLKLIEYGHTSALVNEKLFTDGFILIKPISKRLLSSLSASFLIIFIQRGRSGVRLLVVLVCLTLGMTACGKKGAPIPEEKTPYPRTYPKPIEEVIE